MPFILGILAALAGVYFFVIRARNAADMASDVFDAANDVRLAARRFGFRRQMNRHPVEDIEDPNVACAVVALSYAQLDGPITQNDLTALKAALAHVLSLTTSDVEELLVLSRWLIDQCGGAAPALSRSGRKLYKLEGDSAAGPMFEVLDQTIQTRSERQTEAQHDLRAALHVRSSVQDRG